MRRAMSGWTTRLGMAAVMAGITASAARGQETRPSEPEHAAAEASPFLRVDEVKGKTVSLEIASRDYVPAEGKGPTVTLMGVAHIGERSFYKELQKELSDYDVVLYESVLPAGAKGAGGDTDEQRISSTKAAMGFVGSLIETFHAAEDRYPATLDELTAFATDEDSRLGQWVGNAMIDGWGHELVYSVEGEGADQHYELSSLGGDGKPGGKGPARDIEISELDAPQPIDFDAKNDNIQAQLADALRMQFQLYALDYDQPNWRCSDMALDQVDRALADRGVNFELVSGALAGTSMFAQMAKVFLGVIRFADTLLDGAIADMMKVVMIEMLGDESMVQLSVNQFGEGFNEVIVGMRNQVVIDDLKEVVAHEPDVKSIAVLYGAAHMQDMASRLCDQLGFVQKDERWHTAIKVDIESSVMTERDLRQMRLMMRQAMRMQMMQSAKTGGDGG